MTTGWWVEVLLVAAILVSWFHGAQKRKGWQRWASIVFCILFTLYSAFWYLDEYYTDYTTQPTWHHRPRRFLQVLIDGPAQDSMVSNELVGADAERLVKYQLKCPTATFSETHILDTTCTADGKSGYLVETTVESRLCGAGIC